MATTKQILKDIADALGNLMDHIRQATTVTMYPEADKLRNLWSTFYCIHSGSTFTVLGDELLTQLPCPCCKRLARAVHWTIPRSRMTPEILTQISSLQDALRSQNVKPEATPHGLKKADYRSLTLKEINDGSSEAPLQ